MLPLFTEDALPLRQEQLCGRRSIEPLEFSLRISEVYVLNFKESNLQVVRYSGHADTEISYRLAYPIAIPVEYFGISVVGPS